MSAGRPERGTTMYPYDEPSAADRPEDVEDRVNEDDLDRVMAEVPRGAMALAGVALLVLMLFWLVIYFGVFIPRGPVN